MLLRNNCNINVKDYQGRTPLHWACCYGNYNAVKTLLNNGADTSIIDMDGNSVLHFAAEKGFLDIIQLLVEEYNLNIYSKNFRNQTMLDIAILEEDVDILQYILESNISERQNLLDSIKDKNIELLPTHSSLVSKNFQQISVNTILQTV